MDNIIAVDFREEIYSKNVVGLKQWDREIWLQISGLDTGYDVQVHFALNDDDGDAINAKVDVSDGKINVKIPSFILEGEGTHGLQYCGYAFIYITDGNFGRTVRKIRMFINRRPKPEDYVYTEEERKKWEELRDRVDEIEQNGVSEERIESAVNKYLDKNPVGDVDLTDYAKKGEIPKQLSQLLDDETHRVVTDEEKQAWNDKIDASDLFEILSGSMATTEDIELVDMTGYLLKSGGNVVATSSTNENRVVSEPVYANTGEKYLFTCSANYGNALYVIYDKAGASIGEVKADSTVEGNVLAEHEVIMPDGTSYFRLACNKEILSDGYSAKKVITAGLETTTSPLKGKKWVVIGDSLTEKNIKTSKNYHDYIAEELGCEVVNMGVGGSGYVAGRQEGKCFYQRLEALPQADIITIFGSGNDRNERLGDVADTDTFTVCGSINTTIDMIYQMLPTVQLGIITPTPWMNYPPYETDNNMAKYSRAIVEICKRRGIPCLDLYHCSGLRPWDERFRELAYSKDNGDGVHPDETGHAMISPQIRSFLLGGAQGVTGADGADGKTPVKGTDYFTESDKQAFVTDVINALPIWQGGAY